MRRGSLLTTLALAASLLTAAAAQAYLADPGVIHVQVLDDQTAQPIKDAQVTVIQSTAPDRTLLSDAQGYADFGGYTQAAQVRVQVHHLPYHYTTDAVWVSVDPTTTVPVTMRMRPGAALPATASSPRRDASGTPVRSTSTQMSAAPTGPLTSSTTSGRTSGR